MSDKHDRGASLRRRHPPRADREQRAEPTSKGVRYLVGRTVDLKRGESMKFLMPVRGIEEECFLINFRGHFHAYVNRCRHVPMAMDWVDNQFFAERGRYLMCQTHNAYYEPSNGECIAGPPDTCGKMLYRVPLEIEDGNIFATPPPEEFED
jgi:nitrite reductase/ring-hydroxylating ferredoxin subunit